MNTLSLSDQFRQFIAERPALNWSKLAKELEIDRVNLGKIVKGYRDIPKARSGTFIRIMKKYGWITD